MSVTRPRGRCYTPGIMTGFVEEIAAAPCAVMRAIRRDILGMAHHSAHVAVALSCVDLLAALHGGVLRHEDHFVLSKGHGAMALYAVLAHAGYIERAALADYGKDHTPFAEHPLAHGMPGLEFAAGSLGHGLAVAAGMARGMRVRGNPGRVFALLGDGECDEGSVWEAAAAARGMGLDNLTALIDWNGMQACGPASAVTPGLHLPEAWRGFGWQVEECDGHDVPGLQTLLKASNSAGLPRVLCCRTVKGKGVSFMENNLEWHYRPLRGEERAAALRELADA